MVGLLSSESCCGRPKMRNSVLEGLRDKKLEDIQLDTLVDFRVFNNMLKIKTFTENN